MNAQFRPGEVAPFDGIYLAARLGDQLPTQRVRFKRGDVFPRASGWMYYLYEPDRPTLRLIEDDPEEGEEESA